MVGNIVIDYSSWEFDYEFLGTFIRCPLCGEDSLLFIVNAMMIRITTAAPMI